MRSQPFVDVQYTYAAFLARYGYQAAQACRIRFRRVPLLGNIVECDAERWGKVPWTTGRRVQGGEEEDGRRDERVVWGQGGNESREVWCLWSAD